MRFSVFAYSQEKLLEYGLDVTDALILDWFANFFIGKMEKRIFKDSSDNPKIFGWVKISKIIEDLPVIGITSEKGIRRRFDAFVEKGLMQRETVITQGGKRSYYRTTELYDTLLNTKAAERQESKKTDSDKSIKISQRNSTTFAKNENPQGTKTTYAEIKTGQKSPQGNSSSYAERNSTSLAEGNCSSYALNDSLTSDSAIKDSQIKFNDVRNSAAVNAYSTNIKKQIQDISEKYFGKNAFDFSFSDKAAAFFTKTQIKDYELYFDFIKNKLTETQNIKQVKNPRGLAYRLFFQADIAQSFLEQQQNILLEKQKKEEKQRKTEERKLVCPCCGKKFLPDYVSSCPECSFAIDNFENKEKVNVHIKFLKLPESKKDEYQKEINNIYFSGNFLETFRETPEQRKQKSILREQQEKELNIKYGLVG